MKYLINLIFFILCLSPCEAIAEEPWEIGQKNLRYLPLPMTDSSLIIFKQDISNGFFPKHWSTTVANVTWTDDCIVSLDASTFLPIFPESLNMTQIERAQMDAAVEILKKHEIHQLLLWEYFAQEIERYHCPPNSDEIKEYWQYQVDRDNAETNYGFKLGLESFGK